jgi:hypothetical protein
MHIYKKALLIWRLLVVGLKKSLHRIKRYDHFSEKSQKIRVG